MRTLIGVAGCHAYLRRAFNQRNTWVQDMHLAPDVDVRFFAGAPHPERTPLPDEVFLDCSDQYRDRKEKVKAMFRWTLENGYDRLVKIDDDTYVRPERISTLGEIDYGGFLRQKFYNGCEFLIEHENVLGAFYVLSRKAMQTLLGPDEYPENPIEDRWVCQQLAAKGIVRVDLKPRLGYRLHDSGPPPEYSFPSREQPKADNDLVAAWEFRTTAEMNAVHSIWTTSQAIAMVKKRIAR